MIHNPVIYGLIPMGTGGRMTAAPGQMSARFKDHPDHRDHREIPALRVRKVRKVSKVQWVPKVSKVR